MTPDELTQLRRLEARLSTARRELLKARSQVRSGLQIVCEAQDGIIALITTSQAQEAQHDPTQQTAAPARA